MDFKKYFVYLVVVKWIHFSSIQETYSSLNQVYGFYFYFLIGIYDQLTYFFYSYLLISFFFDLLIYFFFCCQMRFSYS